MFTLIIRRIHMYLTLFLVPWILVFAISTMLMNHRKMFKDMSGKFVIEREEENSLEFADNASSWEKGARIIEYLALDEPYRVNANDPANLMVFTNDLVTPRRIKYTPVDNKLLVEKREFRMTGLIERLHLRRGYKIGNFAGLLWGIVVDVFLLAMLFWVLSGLWIWWEIRPARWLGFVSAGAGLLLILYFVINI